MEALPDERDGGSAAVELASALLAVAMVLAVSIPSFMGYHRRASVTEAKTELRTTLLPVKQHLRRAGGFDDIAAAIAEAAPETVLDDTAVAGILLQRSPEGALCLWRRPAGGTVVGIWEPEEPSIYPTLYGRLDALPAECPDYAGALGLGFDPSGW